MGTGAPGSLAGREENKGTVVTVALPLAHSGPVPSALVWCSVPIVTRFAPSPTGFLHLGHAFSALTAWNASRHGDGGQFILRLEDIDRQRCRDHYATAMLEDLAWLGLSWEEPVRRQSEHFPTYQSALERLSARGVLYPCFCSRKDIAAAGQAPQGPEGPLYPGLCRALPDAERARRLAAGAPHALRLDVGKSLEQCGALSWLDLGAGLQAVQPHSFGDPVLARRDSPTSYHLSVVVDDALQGVTLVTRGHDLFAATPLHRLLQALLDLPTPTYFHHPLLTDASGRRLAKRDGDTSLRSLRHAGHTPEQVQAMAGFASLPGWTGEPTHEHRVTRTEGACPIGARIA